MARRKPFSEMRSLLRTHNNGDNLSARVRRTLVTTLYTQPTSLAIGAINGVASAGIAAWVSQQPSLSIGCFILTIIAVARVTAAYGLSPDTENRSTRQLELIYEIGAFSYALAIGAIAAMTIWYEASAAVEVLMVANALCYGVGICARNAGRPNIAFGQLFLVCAPIMAVSLMVGTLAFIALFVNMLLLWPAMASITMNVFKVLRDSIAAARR